MKKIYFFTAKDLSNVGGGEKVLSVITKKLSIYYDVHILTPYNSETYFDFGKTVTIHNLGVKKNSNSILRKLQYFKIIFLLNRFLNSTIFDSFVACSFLGVVLTSLSTGKRSGLMCWLHTSIYMPAPYLLKKYYLRSLKKFHVISINKTDTELYKKYSDNVSYIPNPITFSAPYLSSCRSKIILSVGRLERNKGFDDLIKICIPILQKHSDWMLYIVGQDDGEKEYLDSLINQAEMEGQIKLFPPTTDIVSFYTKASIFAFASHFESFGLVLAEANVCGLPTISFNCPSGVKDLIEDGYNGFLIDSGDVSTYKKNLETLINSYEFRKNMGLNGVKYVNRFDIESVIKFWISLLK